MIKSLNLSAKAFSAVLGVLDSNTRNYLSMGTKLNSDYLESISSHFSHVNSSWLITGTGEPFLPGAELTQNISTIKGNIIGTAIGNITLDDCKRELATSQKELQNLLISK
ncbi:hypothetical protein ACFP2F_05610 [Hymenobacter artigasi]